jgi:H+-transporting ATPase
MPVGGSIELEIMAVTTRPATEGITLPTLKGATNLAARHGLSGDEARHRLTLGSSAIATCRSTSCNAHFGQLSAPVPWILEAAILPQLFLGDHVEVGVVALHPIANAAIGFFQERWPQTTLDAYKSRLALVA